MSGIPNLLFGSGRVRLILLVESAFPAVTSQLDSRLAGVTSYWNHSQSQETYLRLSLVG